MKQAYAVSSLLGRFVRLLSSMNPEKPSDEAAEIQRVIASLVKAAVVISMSETHGYYEPRIWVCQYTAAAGVPGEDMYRELHDARIHRLLPQAFRVFMQGEVVTVEVHWG